MEFIADMELLLIETKEGKIIPVEHDDITGIIFKALHSCGKSDRLMALNLADKVIYRLKLMKRSDNRFAVQELEQMIKFILNEMGYCDAARIISPLHEIYTSLQ